MGYYIEADGAVQFQLADTDPMVVWNAYVAIISEMISQPVPAAPVVYAPRGTVITQEYLWAAIIANFQVQFPKCGLGITDEGVITYSGTRYNPWAMAVLKALAPFMVDGGGISFLGEDGERWEYRHWLINKLPSPKDPPNGGW